jgi:hypothetical protein
MYHLWKFERPVHASEQTSRRRKTYADVVLCTTLQQVAVFGTCFMMHFRNLDGSPIKDTLKTERHRSALKVGCVQPEGDPEKET